MKKSPVRSLRAKSLGTLDGAFRRLMWQERVWLKAYMGAYDLDIAPLMILGHLKHLGGSATIAALVKQLGQRNTTMTGHLNRLEDHDLVTREYGNAQDRRQVSVHVTAKGKNFLERVKRARYKHIQRACADLTANEIQQLVNLLERYLNGVEQAK